MFESWLTLLCQITIALGLIQVLWKIMDIIYRKWYNYPPGPVGLPIFGTYFWCSKYKYMARLSNQCGPILMTYVGVRKLLLINDLRLCQKLFFSNQGSKRGNDYCVMGEPKRSLTESHGQNFILRRKLLHQSFVTIMDSNYLNNVGINILHKNLFNVFDEAMENKQSIQLRFHVKYAVFSLIFTTIFGEYIDLPQKYSYIYEKFYFGMEKSLNKFGDYQNEMMMYPQINKLWRWFLDTFFRYEIIEGMHLLEDMINLFINQLLKAEIKNDICIKPTLDAYKNGHLSLNALKSDIQSIFVAGMHTTSLIFTETCVMCAKYKHIQKSVYDELLAFKQKYGKFELKHWEHFPLLRALVHEMLRWGFVDALSGVPRVIRDDNVKIGGYNIPKETIVYGFYAKFMHQYQSKDGYVQWRNPARFDLNNFLDDNGKFKSNPAFSTFGIGRRNCPGESLAKREIYLLLGTTLLTYKLDLDKQFCDNIPTKLDLDNPDSELHAKILVAPISFCKR